MECSAKCRRRPCVHGPLSLHQHLPHVAPGWLIVPRTGRLLSQTSTHPTATKTLRKRARSPGPKFRGQASDSARCTPASLDSCPVGGRFGSPGSSWLCPGGVPSGPLAQKRVPRPQERAGYTHTREPPDLPRRCWVSGSADSGLSLSIRGSSVSIHPLWGASVVTGKASSVATLAKSPAWLCLRVPVPDTDGGHVS